MNNPGWSVAAVDEFVLETEQVGFFMEMKPLHDLPLTLASLRFAGSKKQVFPGNHLAPEIAVSFHECGLPRDFSQPPICVPT